MLALGSVDLFQRGGVVHPVALWAPFFYKSYRYGIFNRVKSGEGGVDSLGSSVLDLIQPSTVGLSLFESVERRGATFDGLDFNLVGSSNGGGPKPSRLRWDERRSTTFDKFNPTGSGDGGVHPFGSSNGFGLMSSPFDALCIINCRVITRVRLNESELDRSTGFDTLPWCIRVSDPDAWLGIAKCDTRRDRGSESWCAMPRFSP